MTSSWAALGSRLVVGVAVLLAAVDAEAQRTPPTQRAPTPRVVSPLVTAVRALDPVYAYDRGRLEVDVANLGSGPVNLRPAFDPQCGAWGTPASENYWQRVYTPVNGVVRTVFIATPPHEASGKRCRVDVELREQEGTGWGPTSRLAGHAIQIQASVDHVIDNTWALLGYVAPAWRAGTGICSGKSVGVAGVVDVGIVQYRGDLSFHIRSGPIGTECELEIQRRKLRPRWQLSAVQWGVTRLLSTKDRCQLGSGAYDVPFAGTNLWVGFFPFIKERLVCGDTGLDPTQNNNHGIRRVLERVVLFGPRGVDWRQAFRATR